MSPRNVGLVTNALSDCHRLRQQTLWQQHSWPEFLIGPLQSYPNFLIVLFVGVDRSFLCYHTNKRSLHYRNNRSSLGYCTNRRSFIVPTGALYVIIPKGALHIIVTTGALYIFIPTRALYIIVTTGALYSTVTTGALYVIVPTTALYGIVTTGALYVIEITGALYVITLFLSKPLCSALNVCWLVYSWPFVRYHLAPLSLIPRFDYDDRQIFFSQPLPVFFILVIKSWPCAPCRHHHHLHRPLPVFFTLVITSRPCFPCRRSFLLTV